VASSSTKAGAERLLISMTRRPGKRSRRATENVAAQSTPAVKSQRTGMKRTIRKDEMPRKDEERGEDPSPHAPGGLAGR